MKSGLNAKTVVLLFAGVLAIYFGLFFGIEHARKRKGPWVVEFQTNATGDALLLVSQEKLGVSDVKILCHGERPTNSPGRVSFDRVRQPARFGRVIYEDLTFLPGVVTFDLFGHEIELLPRTLIVNKRPIAWQPGLTVELWPTNKPAEPPRPPKTRAR